MNKIFISFTLFIVSSTVFAIDGHNGILFEMTQTQAESKGFICNRNPKSDEYVIAECKHMEMTGVAFGLPANNYEIKIGIDGHVAAIKTELLGIRSTADYLALVLNIGGFFPIKDEALAYSHTTENSRTEMQGWRANNNATIWLIADFYSSSLRQFLKDKVTVEFLSPAYTTVVEKIRAEIKKKYGTGN